MKGEEGGGESHCRRRRRGVRRLKIMFKLNVTGVAKKKKRNSIGLSCSCREKGIEEKEEDEEHISGSVVVVENDKFHDCRETRSGCCYSSSIIFLSHRDQEEKKQEEKDTGGLR